jgi:hypothetical protein
MNTGGNRKVKAFTMVELMGAVTISIGLILMLYTIFDKVTKVFVEGQSRAVAMEEGRAAMDMIVEDIQMMGVVVDEGHPHLEWVPFSVLSPRASSYIHPDYPWPTNPAYPTPNSLGECFIVNPVDEIPPTADFLVTGGSLGTPPTGSINKLYHHNIRFYSHTDNWRLIHYKLGRVDKYRTALEKNLSGQPVHLKDTPVGALWVYRSAGRLKGEVKKERGEHKTLVEQDAGPGAVGEKLAFAKLIEGVIHFRVRAINPLSKEFPGRELEEFRPFYYPSNPFNHPSNPFKADVLPTHVEVELAVLDRNLLKKVQAGMEQELEGLTDDQKRAARLEEIRDNLDRVYFFKQLVKIKKGGRL